MLPNCLLLATMRFSLQANADDSLRRSISYFAESTESGVKAAIKELIAALELYVKVQLIRSDADPSNPVLVFERFTAHVDPASGKYELRPIGVSTVTLAQSLERLAWLQQSIPEADRIQLIQLKKIRNSIEHFSVDEESAKVRDLYAAVIGFSIRYLHVYLGLNFLELLDGNTWRRALEIEPRLRRAAERSASDIYVDLTTAADRAIGAAVCHKCGSAMMVDAPGNWSGHRCAVCGFNHAVETCYRCQRLFFWDLLCAGEGGTMLCEACAAQD